MSESLSMKWNRRLRGLTMFVFNFGVESLEQSVKLGRFVILISLAIPFSTDRKSTRLNSSHVSESRMPSSA